MFDLSTFMISLGGSGLVSYATVQALSKYLGERWATDHKAELDRVFEQHRDALERERKLIEAKTGHRIWVTQLQFETEFSSLKSCFDAAGKVLLAFNGLLPMVGLWESDEKEARLALDRRLRDMADKHNDFVAVTQAVFPFIPVEISDQFEQCAKATQLGMMHVQADPVKALRDRWDNYDRRNDFSRAYHQAAKLARDRFALLSLTN